MKQYLVLFKDKVDKSLLSDCTIKREFSSLPKIIVIQADERTIKELQQSDQVESIMEDKEDGFDEAMTEEVLSDQEQESYALELLQAHEFWKRGYYGKGVKIAVLDGGCQPHEDLKIAGGYNAYDPTQPYMSDYRDHGTHCVGIINMQHNGIGFKGIAPEAELYVVKMDDNEGGSNGLSAQVAAVNWAIENNMDIISMSVSGSSDDPIRREAFRSASEDHGIICCTSASNQQRDVPLEIETIRYPAKYDFVVGVANIDSNKKRWESSSVGHGLTLCAPGVSIMSTVRDTENEVSQKYGSKTGTSMATPYIAGMFALYKEMFPELNREELIEKMKKNAEPLGDTRQYGAGLAQFPVDNQRNIQMKKREGDLWANLFPITLATNVFNTKGDSLQNLLDAYLDAEIETNDQGIYFKFDNGLQICISKPFEMNATSPYNGVYRSAEPVKWHFPTPFKDGTYYGNASAPAGNRWASRTGFGEGVFMAIRQYSFTEAEKMLPTTAIAVGLWKDFSLQN